MCWCVFDHQLTQLIKERNATVGRAMMRFPIKPTVGSKIVLMCCAQPTRQHFWVLNFIGPSCVNNSCRTRIIWAEWQKRHCHCRRLQPQNFIVPNFVTYELNVPESEHEADKTGNVFLRNPFRGTKIRKRLRILYSEVEMERKLTKLTEEVIFWIDATKLK